MLAMVLEKAGDELKETHRPIPEPGPGQLVLQVEACAVCRTDLHLVDGDLPDARYPIVPGHEIIGRVVKCGEGVTQPLGARLGVSWLGYSCGTCAFCQRGEENLCDHALFTGCQLDGGFAEYAVANHRYCYPIDPFYSATNAAPLMCAGLIGYRSLRMCGADIEHLGIYGFGAAAHIITQIALWRGINVSAFTRAGDEQAQAFARRLGASWAGESGAEPADKLDAAIIFAPDGKLVPVALHAVRKGGVVVCGGIHMSDIPSFPYSLLWGERHIRSVANLARVDASEFLDIAPRVPVHTEVTCFPLHAANEALASLREGRHVGAAVLVP